MEGDSLGIWDGALDSDGASVGTSVGFFVGCDVFRTGVGEAKV